MRSESDALAFTRRACEHLSAKGTLRVEAWSEGRFDRDLLPGSVTFRLKPCDGPRWLAEQGPLHHGGISPTWTAQSITRCSGVPGSSVESKCWLTCRISIHPKA